MPIFTSKFPLGFLDLVGAQNFGENPRQLAEFVQPMIDIGEQYLVSTQVLATHSNGAAASGFNGFTVPLVVPPGEVWRLFAYNISVATGAGVTGTFGPTVRPTPAGGNRMQLSDSLDFVASKTVWKAATAVPIWLTSGMELGIEVQNLVGGNPAVSGQALYTRLRS